MGKLVNGKWFAGDVATTNESGAYKRQERSFREEISANHKVYTPELGRYHLYVSYACPWAHRTLLYRSLKGLEDHISVSAVSPDMLEEGWKFDPSFTDATEDHLFGFSFLHQIYTKADPNVSTSVTVPVLWDKKTSTIVNNESSEIIRIFNHAFDDLTGNKTDFYPETHRSEIDAWNQKIYEHVNNGVYLCGFAKSQEAYQESVEKLFSVLDEIDAHLEKNSFLVGNQLTEADLRLLPTLLRFDPVYFIHFKCSKRKISEYTHLSRYFSSLSAMQAVQKSTFFEHIVRHYYYSHPQINPYRIIPNVSFPF